MDLDRATMDPIPRSRRHAAKRIIKQWRSQLIDVSAGNRLLYYRDLKVAAVDLGDIAAGPTAELLTGKRIRVGRLWPDSVALAGAVRSLKAIAKPSRLYAEEFGLQITFIASGFASWQVGEGAKEPSAPVLLRQLTLHAIPGAIDAFELEASEDVQLNPVLLHTLEAEHGVEVDEAELLEAAGGNEHLLFERLGKLLVEDLPGFSITERQVIANFAYASQAMVADLADENVDFLAAHDLIAALAGHPDATEQVRTQGNEVSLHDPDHCPPSDEHLILDADGSQSYVINAVVNGQHLVVQGPPGTGKTQTITNTVADLVARGKTVLFVAQKRAAITAVLDRLRTARLDNLVLDLFDGASSRKSVVQELGQTIERASVTARPNVKSLHDAYGAARDLLVSHEAAMHELRPPWGLSLLGSKDIENGEITDGLYDWEIWTREGGTDVRLAANDLVTWDEESHEALRRTVQELFAIGGLEAELLRRPGWAVSGLPTPDALHHAEAVLDSTLGDHLPQFLLRLTAMLNELEIEIPAVTTASWCRQLASLHNRIVEAHRRGWGPLIGNQNDDQLDDLIFASADKEYRHSNPRPLGRMARRRTRREALAIAPSVTEGDLHEAAVAARELRSAWASSFRTPCPAVPPDGWPSVREALGVVEDDIQQLQAFVQFIDLDDLTGLPGALEPVRRDRQRRIFPRIHSLRARLVASGCGPVLDDLATVPAPSAEAASNRLSHAFAAAVIEHLHHTDPRIADYTAADLQRATGELIAADEKLRDANASRIRRLAAERLIATLDAHPDQAEAVRGQVKRKRGFLPVRQLVGEAAPDVVLAAKPIWAASPQTVSQLLPTRVLFDVVLFDEASQVIPAAALPSIARGRQAVVAGDDLQLPPTTLFTRTAELEVASVDLDSVEEGDEADEDPSGQVASPSLSVTRVAEIPDTESILDAVSIKLGTQRSRYLAWHYRSRDEKLIATSNTFLYRPRGRMMTTFPAAESSDALRLERCSPSSGLGKTNLSPVEEVRRVVDLMLAHATEQVATDSPKSLGVIAFGAKHAARIEREFEQRLADAPIEIQRFFSKESAEQYFIKNIERVQGDERDVILLSIGYAKGTDGRLRYNWGPVLSEGGHRRVNVAITRARHQMRLVTSFDVLDVDPYASAAEGFALMYRFLRFSASGGTDFGDEGVTNVPCNTFEADIQSHLEARGLRVIPQWGVGGYRLDFAIRHPRKPGKFLLAVEADGASYHSGLVARERDRLRQRQLESRGWRFVRIWSSDYFYDPDKEIDRVVEAYEEELAKLVTKRSTVSAKGSPLPSERDEVVVPDWDESGESRCARPDVPAGYSIAWYTDEDLQQMVRWVMSDDLPHTKADIYEIVKRELGFMRDGKNIRLRITAAVDEEVGAPS